MFYGSMEARYKSVLSTDDACHSKPYHTLAILSIVIHRPADHPGTRRILVYRCDLEHHYTALPVLCNGGEGDTLEGRPTVCGLDDHGEQKPQQAIKPDHARRDGDEGGEIILISLLCSTIQLYDNGEASS